MSRLVASFDPSAGSGQFIAGAVNPCSVLWVMNESPNFLALDFGGAGTVKIIQPWYDMKLTLSQPANQVNWSVVATLQSGSAPVSMVYVELFDPAEDVSALLSGPLFRQSNVGNAAAVSASASAVQNDGNAANTTIVEGTPSGAASSQALITNDGRAILGGGNVTISAAGVFATPAGAIPGASISGAVPEAQSLNNQVTSSDNGTAQLYSTVDGRGIALGYKDSGGTYHTVLTINTDGTVTAGTIHATADNATSLASSISASHDTANMVIHPTNEAAGTPQGFGVTVWNGSAEAFRQILSDVGVLNADTVGDGVNPSALTYHFGGTAPSHPYVSLGQGGTISAVNGISGSGSATVNHGLSVAPDAAVVNTNNGQNSTTFGSGSYTSSTVYIYQFNAQPWVGIAYKA